MCEMMDSSAELEGLHLLIERQKHQLHSLEHQLEQHLQREKEYNHVKQTLSNVSARLRVPKMIPLTKVAFMPGELIHTNEVLVLLGDGYFVETTSSKASQIADRRLTHISRQINEMRDAINRHKQLITGGNQFVDEQKNSDEIREVFEQLSEEEAVQSTSVTGKRVSRLDDASRVREREALLKKSRQIGEELKRVQTSDRVEPEPQESANDELDSNSGICSDQESRGVDLSAVDRKKLLEKVENLMKQSEDLDEVDRMKSDDDSDDVTDIDDLTGNDDTTEGISSSGDSRNEQSRIGSSKTLKRSVSFSKEISVREFSPQRSTVEDNNSAMASLGADNDNVLPLEDNLNKVHDTKAVVDTVLERLPIEEPREKSVPVSNCPKNEKYSDNLTNKKPVSLFKKNKRL